MKFVLKSAAALLVILVFGLIAVYARYGTGQLYPDTSTAPLRPSEDLQRVAALDFPPGNVAVAPSGRVFFNYHPFAKAERFVPATMFELVNGQPVPYPDAEFQRRYQGVFGMTVDAQNRLWLIEPRGLDHERTRLLAFDLASNTQVFEHWFEPAQAQFTQDLRVSPDGQTVYLADTGLFQFTSASLLVFDLPSRTHRALLASEPAAQPQRWVTQRFDGKPHTLGYGLVAFTVGLDGIELSRDGQWLYFATMSHDNAYRVPTAALKDVKLSSTELSAAIQKIGNKPLSDGITLDAQGNLLITDIERGSIARLGADGKLQTLVRRADIVWSDGVAVGPDGSVWLTDSGIPAYLDQLARPPALDVLKSRAPYGLYRLAPATK